MSKQNRVIRQRSEHGNKSAAKAIEIDRKLSDEEMQWQFGPLLLGKSGAIRVFLLGVAYTCNCTSRLATDSLKGTEVTST